MRLVAHVIKKYQCTDYEMEDLLSVGTIGLIKAVNTFNIDKGSRLATYAAKCVENAMLMPRLPKRMNAVEPDQIGLEKYHAGSYNKHGWQTFETETPVIIFCYVKQEGRNGKEK